MPYSPPIYFHFLIPLNGLKERTRLKQFIYRLILEAKRPLSRLDYIFCDDAYLLKINRKHLNHDFYTDIITFNMANLSSPIESEIYISLPRVRDNALKYDTSLKEELHRVIFHGALHLAGFSDQSKKEKERMRRKEDHCLRRYFG
jgi:probable rRNA maturation factor